MSAEESSSQITAAKKQIAEPVAPSGGAYQTGSSSPARRRLTNGLADTLAFIDCSDDMRWLES
jgi:hypothetical protein